MFMNRNYKIFLAASSVLSFAVGFYSPFFIIFVQKLGGGDVRQFGFSVGLMALAFSVTSYFAGKYSDKFGRKMFLVTSGIALSGIIVLYTFIKTTVELNILQIVYGFVNALYTTMEISFLGDVTEKASRGLNVGRYRAFTGLFEALAIMGGGYLVGSFGFKSVFYIAAGLIVVATLILSRLKKEELTQ
jgi:MFS family permease